MKYHSFRFPSFLRQHTYRNAQYWPFVAGATYVAEFPNLVTITGTAFFRISVKKRETRTDSA